MPDKANTDLKRFELKQQWLRRAFNEGRGPEVIAKLNKLYNDLQKTLSTTNDQMVTGWRSILGGPDQNITLAELEHVSFEASSRTIRRYNMCEMLIGSDRRLHETMIMPGSSSIN